MTITDLVAAPDQQAEPLKMLAHVEFQLRVLGLLCAAAAEGRTKLRTPGSLDVWSNYIRLNRSALRCHTCEVAALDVAESIDAEVAPGTSVRQMRNQVFHGGPDPEKVDVDALHRVVSTNAEKIIEIYVHGHITRLEPFFIEIDGELAALNDYSEGSATYWPRRAPAADIAQPHVLDALQELEPQGGDRQMESFGLDIQRDLRGFAQRESVQTLVDPPNPIVVRWELRTSGGTIPRVDRFQLQLDGARIWQSGSGPRPYKAFLADICNWALLKERLLEELEEQVRLEGVVSEELFGDLKRNIPDVPALVRVAGGRIGDGGDLTIAQACEQITAMTDTYRGYTTLITLTGEAGSGKTHSLLQYARDSLAAGDKLTPLAIYISSSRESANSLDTLLDNRAKSTLLLSKASALALCRAGLAILVIDGFDEMLGFRTYDNPLSGLKPILDELRGRGTLILSARSSYAEARLRQSLEVRSTMDWPPYVMALELLPWREEQLRELTSRLPVESTDRYLSPQLRQLLTTPFFCLAYAAWARSPAQLQFLEFVVDRYLQRERGKLRGPDGAELFDAKALVAIFCEVAELSARNAVPEVSEEDMGFVAELALGRELTNLAKRRLGSLCGMSAEWSEDERSFRFTHLTIAEYFLALQVTRLPVDQATSLLFSVPISALCAQLIVSILQAQPGRTPTDLIASLQERVASVEPYEESLPGTISLGEFWAKVHGVGEGDRAVRRITVENLELGGSGRVSLHEARIEHLVVGPGVELQLTASHVDRLDLSKSTGAALLGASYKQVLELLTKSELAVGQSRIMRALGVEDDTPDGVSEIDSYFKAQIILARGPIIVRARDYAPEADSRAVWVTNYGLPAWQGFVRRMLEEGKLALEKVPASGRRKVRLRRTERFDDPTNQ
ncbi:NACHT domain-containing protein [Micromonospora chersina]